MAIDRNRCTDAEVQVDLLGPAATGVQPPLSAQGTAARSSSVASRWLLPLSVCVMMVAVGVRSSTGFWEGFAFQLAREYLDLGGLGRRRGSPAVPGPGGAPQGGGGAQSFYFPLEDLGADGKVLFRKHDVNADGVLSMEEFAPLSRRLLSFNVS